MKRNLSDRDIGGASGSFGHSMVFDSFSSIASSNNCGEFVAFDSLMDRKASSPITGATSVKYNEVVGVNPISHSAA